MSSYSEAALKALADMGKADPMTAIKMAAVANTYAQLEVAAAIHEQTITLIELQERILSPREVEGNENS